MASHLCAGMALADLHIKSHPTVIVTHPKVFDARLEAILCPFRILSSLIVTRTRKEMPRNLAGESPWLYVSLIDHLQI
jgi:hypothetical protein